MDDLPLPTIQQTFDEQPIGGAPKLMLDEYPPGTFQSNIQTLIRLKSKPKPNLSLSIKDWSQKCGK